MGIFSALRNLYSGQWGMGNSEWGVRQTLRTPHSTLRTHRRCRVEELESRRMMAADGLAPHVMLGSVYFEEATGDDSQPDIIQVSFVGGAAGTTLNRVTINGDKHQDGLSAGDIFFDTAAGGLGAFEFGGLSIVSANGFTVNNVAVVDGGSQIVFDLSGFDAGEKLVLSVDADEAQFIQANAGADGQITPNEVDVNSLVEGAEFQRSIIVGEFSATGYVDLTLTGTYWDSFDDEFATAHNETGLTLDLPNDAYSPDHDYTDRTAGAVDHAAQIPLASLSGWVYHDQNDNGVFAHGGETGIGGVTLELLDANGNPTGITTTTSTDPATLGFYEFRNLYPGTYGVREVHPDGWLDGKDAAGDHGGAAASEAAGRVDKIFGAILNFGDHALEYNFGELLPGSIRGTVQAHTDEDCDFDHPEILLEGVRIDLLDANGNFIRFTLTDANGAYAFTALAPGIYSVREHQPAGYYDGEERVGTAGGVLSANDLVSAIAIGSNIHAVDYDFCEHVGVMLSGNVYHDRDNDGIFDRGPEDGIGDVLLQLLDGNGNDTGLRATTDAEGFYKFNNLAAGKYTVVEVHPSGWLDGKDTPGNLGGVAAVSPPGDMISQIMINWGEMGTEYNFGELLPGSIAGRVIAHSGPECDFDNPQILLEGVQIDLLDGNGTVLATTYTNANGEYSFTGLRPGTYRVHEHQPNGYYDGEERVGTVGGALSGNDTIGSIPLASGANGIQYDFCEHVGVMLSGNVYHDRDDDGVFDRDTEAGIGGVLVKLLDGNGSDTGLRATTNAEGFYKFNNLAAGKYTVMEVHPVGWLDGKDTPGNLGGVAAVSPPGDMISTIMINWGEMGTEYNFGELLPGSIGGRVAICDESIVESDVPIAGVQVDLLNGDGQVVATTTTNANGEYSFANLRPGVYSVREHQPQQYFDDEAHVGSGGGVITNTNEVSNIGVDSAEHLVAYDFCELPPAEISGYVYIDGAPIIADVPPSPEEIAAVRNGLRTPDDTRLPGVVLELRNGETGAPIFVGDAIAGSYSGAATDPIQVVTDANGFYHFGGLRGGLYAVVEMQPGGVLDNVDTRGTLGGFAANPVGLPTGGTPTAGEEAIINQFRAEVGPDAIVLIPLQYGQHSQENDFSEVVLQPPENPPPPPPPPPEPPETPPPPPVFGPPGIPYVPPLVFLPNAPVIRPPDIFGGSSDVVGYTWHLSVVNAGWPRSITPAEVRFQLDLRADRRDGLAKRADGPGAMDAGGARRHPSERAARRGVRHDQFDAGDRRLQRRRRHRHRRVH